MRKALSRDKERTTIIPPYDKPIHVSKVHTTLSSVSFDILSVTRTCDPMIGTFHSLLSTNTPQKRVYQPPTNAYYSWYGPVQSKIGFTIAKGMSFTKFSTAFARALYESGLSYNGIQNAHTTSASVFSVPSG